MATQVEAPPKYGPQADIDYHPNEEKWRARTARRLAEDPSLPKRPLPKGFPKSFESSLVWGAKDWTDESQWVYKLTEAELKEIDDALKHFNSLNLRKGHVNRDTFPLPTLGPTLRDLSRELHYGRGFFVLRTIPVDDYSRDDVVTIYAGVSSWVGNLRGVQDENASVLAHIKDLSSIHPAKTIGAPAYTTEKQVFHTDAGDIIALFALETAAEGGLSRISSSWRVYNDIAQNRPDLIGTLAEQWSVDTFGGNPPFIWRSPLFYHDGKMIIQYARRVVTGYQGLVRSKEIPPITEAQAEALDTLQFFSEKDNVELNFQKGDIQYINNLSIFHARDAFVDTPEKHRHLLRLWLRDEELAWSLPEGLKPHWKAMFYTATPEEQRFQLEPEIRSALKGGGVKEAEK
ncbi:Clavaminate synthase-like protein [Coprinopsis marcescibilis]|uniref:Clavaminate synthase-like protein n=1 Tax=Coprinopsis marcescibilis TaxID=230819 RepID=A0A5C3KPW3_COPMA|nr:Clavaminate synthase-like protein [Coprinopsis marcescibilis]